MEEKQLPQPEVYKISFSSNEGNHKKFKIPIYQRPFAWKREEVETLLDDLVDYEKQKYYLGNIVVNKRKDGYLEVIDGQQRLTVLYLLYILLTKDTPPFELKYEIRKEDDEFLKELPNILKKEDTVENVRHFYQNKKASVKFLESIETIFNTLFSKEKNDDYTQEKGQKLTKIKEKTVYLGITYLPETTDVAKYFEVMNSRGKQLEQHQVLKAKLLKKLQNENDLDYAKIWDYCSDMSIYLEELIYKKFNKKNYSETGIRKKLFEFVNCEKLEFLKKENTSQKEPARTAEQEDNNEKEKDDGNKLTLLKILKPDSQDKKQQSNSEEKESKPEKEYRSIINFSTFLLHTLKVFVAMNPELFQDKEPNLEKALERISLDDKKLIKTFEEYFNNKDKNIKEKVKKFIKFLLKMRILFDYFVFKRNSKEEKAEFKRLKYKDGKVIFEEEKTEPLSRILMLQLLFNFTAPQWKQQEWIGCVLSWLYREFKNDKNIIENAEKLKKFYEKFLKFLENLDKILAIERLKENSNLGRIFDKIIEKGIEEIKKRKNLEVDIKTKLDGSKPDKNKPDKSDGILNQGTATPHYWFYKLEYLLWKNRNTYFYNNNFQKPFDFDYKKIENYILTRKSSIEHIQAQSRENENGWDKETDQFGNKIKIIDWFGNLALISSHLNSALLDKEYQDKRLKIQEQLNHGTIESLKMLLVYSKYAEWTPKECKEHHEKMIDLLVNDLTS